jgi:hypothetical protein
VHAGPPSPVQTDAGDYVAPESCVHREDSVLVLTLIAFAAIAGLGTLGGSKLGKWIVQRRETR